MPLEPDRSDDGGRGLLLVSELADKWGVAERALDKVVWCEWAGMWGAGSASSQG